MTEPKTPATNTLGLTKADYKGLPSTMCKGGGHDRISEAIIQASYDLSIDGRDILKMSGGRTRRSVCRRGWTRPTTGLGTQGYPLPVGRG